MFLEQDDVEYHKTFTGFNLASKMAVEKLIEERGNRCEEGDPIIKYDQCSQDYIQLWEEASKSMESHVRKPGPTIVPGMSALVWPGLSLQHYLGESIPAWSVHARNLSEVFGKWVFDPNVQCHKTKIDTAVCASDATGKFEAVVPWLGGDFNPW